MLPIIPFDDPRAAGDTPDALLRGLGAPAALHLAGAGGGRRRAVVTLLHGDEPSGLRAVHALLRSGFQPAGDTLIVIGNVPAAFKAVRYLPGERDLNRAFFGPWDDAAGQLAAAVLGALRRFEPTCVVDVHNTSGSGPAFGVSAAHTADHETLTGHFTERLVVTDITLGALMEAAEPLCPALTVECGGALDAYADGVAMQGLRRYLSLDDPLAATDVDLALDLFVHPVRLELAPGARLAIDEVPGGADVTLRTDVERLNFGSVEPGTAIGWCAQPARCLRARRADGTDVLARLFGSRGDGRLCALTTLRLFMVTSSVAAAVDDCLFYVVPAAGWDA